VPARTAAKTVDVDVSVVVRLCIRSLRMMQLSVCFSAAIVVAVGRNFGTAQFNSTQGNLAEGTFLRGAFLKCLSSHPKASGLGVIP
jgi:hypothetical protein